MAELSDFAENLVLDWLLTAVTATRPTAWHIGLTTDSIIDAHTGSEPGTDTEITGGAYTRLAAAFESASGGTSVLSSAVSFCASTSSYANVKSAGIFNSSVASASADLLCFSDLTTARDVDTGDTLTFASGTGVVVNLT